MTVELTDALGACARGLLAAEAAAELILAAGGHRPVCLEEQDGQS
jgi:hypothetical protein